MVLGDVESGAGVALSSSAVRRLVDGAHAAMARSSASGSTTYPLLHALSLASVADSNKPELVADGRVLHLCARALRWGTPGAPADGSGFAGTGRWPPRKVHGAAVHCAELLYQLSLSAPSKPALLAHDGCMGVLRLRAAAGAADDPAPPWATQGDFSATTEQLL